MSLFFTSPLSDHSKLVCSRVYSPHNLTYCICIAQPFGENSFGISLVYLMLSSRFELVCDRLPAQVSSLQAAYSNIITNLIKLVLMDFDKENIT